MENGYIQLPYGFIENQNEDEKMHFNLPLNYKKSLLFDKLPYVAQLNNPAINNVVKGKENDDLSIQKFLLATDLLENAIQDNLGMIVTDGEFNDAGVRRVLDTKFPSIMHKPTATNFMFRDKAKFDIQNPVIGGLYNQLLTKKQKEKLELEAIGKAPSVKDIDIQKRLDDISKFNLGINDNNDNDDDDYDNDNNDNNSGRLPLFPPTPPSTPSTLSETQRFLLDGGNERVAEAIGLTTSTPKAKQITFSDTITKVFPKTRREISRMPSLDSISEETIEEDFDVSSSVVGGLKDGNEPIDLDFFCGGEKNKQKLYENATKNIGVLNNSNKKFIDYLTSKYGDFVLSKNKIKIHLESGQIFHDNNITNESFYDFLNNQQDLNKKELDITIPIGNDFNVYVREILTDVVDDDYDLQTNPTSKFLFYNFNTLRQIQRLPPLTVRHSQIAEDEFAMKIVQSHNWQYFIETLLHISNNEINIDDFNLQNDEVFHDYLIIQKTQQNLNYCKNFYEEVFNDISYFLHKKIKEMPDEFVEKIQEDLANEIYFTKKIKEIESHVEFLKVFNRFYFKTGRFPGNHFDLMVVPPGIKPSFVKTRDEISPSEINEKFQSGPSYGLAAVQFIAALNVYFGGDKELSRNVMSEFFRNMSLQALTIDDDSIKIGFDEIIELNKNLKSLIREDDRSDIEIIDLKEQQFEEIKDKTQLIEEEVVSNIINDVRIEYPSDDQYLSFPNTPSEISKESDENNKIDQKAFDAFNERDTEISQELITTARNDLIKSITDEEGEAPTEVLNNVASSYELQQESTPEKNIRDHVQTTIKKNNKQYLEKTKKPLSKIPRAIKTTSPVKLTDLITGDETKKHQKKPYDRE